MVILSLAFQKKNPPSLNTNTQKRENLFSPRSTWISPDFLQVDDTPGFLPHPTSRKIIIHKKENNKHVFLHLNIPVPFRRSLKSDMFYFTSSLGINPLNAQEFVRKTSAIWRQVAGTEFWTNAAVGRVWPIFTLPFPQWRHRAKKSNKAICNPQHSWKLTDTSASREFVTFGFMYGLRMCRFISNPRAPLLFLYWIHFPLIYSLVLRA